MLHTFCLLVFPNQLEVCGLGGHLTQGQSIHRKPGTGLVWKMKGTDQMNSSWEVCQHALEMVRAEKSDRVRIRIATLHKEAESKRKLVGEERLKMKWKEEGASWGGWERKRQKQRLTSFSVLRNDGLLTSSWPLISKSLCLLSAPMVTLPFPPMGQQLLQLTYFTSCRRSFLSILLPIFEALPHVVIHFPHIHQSVF